MKIICEFCEWQVDDYLFENHQRFFHAEEFSGDAKEAEKEQKFICDLCGKELLVKNFHSHQRTHKLPATESRFDCDECDQAFDSATKLQMHYKNRHTETLENEIYQCEVCWEVLSEYSRYSSHMNNHFGFHRYPKPCPLCPGEFAREFHIMKFHNDSYVKMRPYSCTLCDKRFYQENAAHHHYEKFHCDKGPYLCPECGSSFPISDTLTEHRPHHITYVAKKTGPRKYVNLPKHESCPICGKKYAATRKRHILIQQHIESVHELKNDFKCDICEKSFYTQHKLKRHMKRHFRNDQCYVCRNRVDNIKEHYEIYHSNLKHTCEICFKKFQTSYYLQRHIRSNHLKKEFTCDICGVDYVNLATIRRHMKIHLSGRLTSGRGKVSKLNASKDVKSDINYELSD